MSAMMDVLSGKKEGREAELEAALEHATNHLGIVLGERDALDKSHADLARRLAESGRTVERLTAENGRLRAHLEQIKNAVVGDKEPRWSSDWSITSTRGWIADVCDHALAIEQ